MWNQAFIDSWISAAGLPPQEAQRVRKAFLGRHPRQEKTVLNPESFAKDLIWGAQGRILAKRHPDKAQLTGHREKPLLVLPIRLQASVFEVPIQANIHHTQPLSDALLLLALTAPAEKFVTEATSALEAKAKAEVEESLKSLSDELMQAATLPGFPKEELQETIWHTLRRPVRLEIALNRLKDKAEKLTHRTKEATALQELLAKQDFHSYAEHFPLARTLSRRLTLYVGPTNSGKTFHALNTLAASEDGAYLAPLRLLALEGQEELENRGRPTSFLTGEERDLKPQASFVSSTIEMIDLRREVGVAVIDEVQLLAEPERGWAWSAAVIGAPAKHIVMTGSPEVVPVVEALAKYLKEPLEVKRQERFTPLHVKRAPSRLDSLEPGTAVICFSRRDCLGLKQMLEEKHRVAVIYGNLSPQVRREEARRFRSGEADVVVATDAIALGLNLPIKTILFYTLTKWNGERVVQLSPREIRQIGGRAGRFGKADEGFVGAFSRKELRIIQQAFSQDLMPLSLRVQVRPSLFHLDAIQQHLGVKKLVALLDVFQRRMRFDDPLLVPASLSDMIALAGIVDEYNLALEDKFTFSCAPLDAKNEAMLLTLRRWVKTFSEGKEIHLEKVIPVEWTTTTAEDQDDLYTAEQEVKVLTAYAWLSYRYSAQFPEIEACEVQRRILNDFIERTLRKKGLARRCTSCRKPLPPLHPFGICDSCYHSSWTDDFDDEEL